MKIVVISATSLIARHCIMRWAESGNHDFKIAGRNKVKLEATAADLRLRYPNSTFSVSEIAMSDPSSVGHWIDDLRGQSLDLCLIAQGSLTNQLEVSNNLVYLHDELQINAVSVAMFLEGFARIFEEANHGQIAVIGSVAGDRGRAYNYSYGASKALVETYVEGLQQRLAKTNVTISLIKPGPTATPMTELHRGKMASPLQVSHVIVQGLAKNKRVIYAPSTWRLIMFLVRKIPFVLFKKMTF